jgi:flagellar basal-body rod modification protein FlgD
VNQIDPTATTSTTSFGAAPQSDSALGRDAFLSLLITQLQNQNPLEPQADGEFLAQLAQFSSLENLEGISRDMAALRTLFEIGLFGDLSGTGGTEDTTGSGGTGDTTGSGGTGDSSESSGGA